MLQLPRWHKIQTTSIDYSGDGLREHLKKNKLINKQDSGINPFAQVPPAATDATSSQHLFVLFLNTFERHDATCCPAHINHSFHLRPNCYPSHLSSLYPPHHTCINCVARQFHKAKSHPHFPHHLHLHLSINLSVDILIPLINTVSPSKARHTIRKCFAHYQRSAYLSSGLSRTKKYQFWYIIRINSQSLTSVVLY